MKKGGNWDCAAFHPPFDPAGNVQDGQERGLWASCASQRAKMRGQWLCFGSYRAGTGIAPGASPTNKVGRANGAVPSPVRWHQPAGRSLGQGWIVLGSPGAGAGAGMLRAVVGMPCTSLPASGAVSNTDRIIRDPVNT